MAGRISTYSVANEGGAATLLTPGEFEVEHVSYSGDASEILYSSNQNDIDRRHIWRVGSAGGRAPAAVTGGAALEWSPVLVTGGLAYIRADARGPARATIQLGAISREMAPETIPADFPAEDLVVPQQVVYIANDGMPVHAQLFLPAGGVPGAKHRALVFMHGGSRRQMLLGWHYMDYYNNAYAMNQYLASQGYVVLSINYRSGIGYGSTSARPSTTARAAPASITMWKAPGSTCARAPMSTRRTSACGAGRTAAT